MTRNIVIWKLRLKSSQMYLLVNAFKGGPLINQWLKMLSEKGGKDRKTMPFIIWLTCFFSHICFCIPFPTLSSHVSKCLYLSITGNYLSCHMFNSNMWSCVPCPWPLLITLLFEHRKNQVEVKCVVLKVNIYTPLCNKTTVGTGNLIVKWSGE